MDHRVSKDMISSGMTPSGEKTQADLGKTQYGSAPSPNRLMDAYQSMYDKKEEVINEMKLGDVSGSADFASRNIKGAKGSSKPPTQEKTGRSQEEIKKSVDQSIQRGKERAEKRERLQGIMNKYGESVDLLAAYYAVYEHHQKDENGNTIPHEDDVKEGKINPGLQAFLDKKKGKKGDKEDKKKAKKGKGGKPDFLDLDKDGDKKEPMKKASKEMKEGAGLYANIHAKRKRGGKMRKKGAKGAPSSQDFANAARTAKEDLDLFDNVILEFVDQGYDERDVIQAMSSLNEEQLQNLDEAIPLIGAALKGVAMIGKKAIANLAVKGAGKAGLKATAQAFKNPTAGNISKVAGQALKGAVKDPIGTKIKLDTARSMVPGGGGANKVTPLNRTTKATADSRVPVNNSADLFDIVKGQLLDEGLSEEEIRDIMLELTPEEIMNEMNGTRTSLDDYGTPEKRQAVKDQVNINKKVNRYGGKTPSGTDANQAKKGLDDTIGK